MSGQISADLVEWLAADQKVNIIFPTFLVLEPGCPELLNFGHSPNIAMSLAGVSVLVSNFEISKAHIFCEFILLSTSLAMWH